MVDQLAGGARLDSGTRDIIRDQILHIVFKYNYNLDSSRRAEHDERTIRGVTIVEQLTRIERACEELASAFDASGQATIDAAVGCGLEGLRGPFGAPEVDHHRDLISHKSELMMDLRALVSRYSFPISVAQSRVEISKILDCSNETTMALLAQGLTWREGARALAMYYRERRIIFEASFRPATERSRDIAHRGPSGLLAPSERGRAARRRRQASNARRIERRRAASIERGGGSRVLSNRSGDKGSFENAYGDMWGHPKWQMVRSCYDLIAGHLSRKANTSYGGGVLADLVEKIHMCATGEDEAPGFKDYIHTAVKILKYSNDFIYSYPHNAIDDPLRDEKEISLAVACSLGVYPDWVPD